VRKRIEECESLVGHEFEDRSLLQRALTHASAVEDTEDSNERLEYLGDAIADAAVAEMLYRHSETLTEGEMTAARADVASRATMARVAGRMGLKEHLGVGNGMPPREQWPRSLAANVYEAVVGAVFLDGGYDAARDFVRGTLGPEVNRAVSEGGARDYKSALQEAVQADGLPAPTYETLCRTGPDHDTRFLVAARYTSSLPKAPDGEYVVVQYKGTYADEEWAETVTLKKDPDGWRVAGYFVKPTSQ